MVAAPSSPLAAPQADGGDGGADAGEDDGDDGGDGEAAAAGDAGDAGDAEAALRRELARERSLREGAQRRARELTEELGLASERFQQQIALLSDALAARQEEEQQIKAQGVLGWASDVAGVAADVAGVGRPGAEAGAPRSRAGGVGPTLPRRLRQQVRRDT